MTSNIFVIGLDESNLEALRDVAGASTGTFHQLLTVEELQDQETIPLPDLLDKARAQLDAFDGTIDAIVGYWDFPVSLMVPILCEQYGLPSASLEAVLRCEHKYWSRLVQQQVIEEYPRFSVVDLTDDEPTLPEGLHYPVWLKPVKSASSAGAHHVANDAELREAVRAVRPEIGRVAEPFTYVLDMVDLPPEIEGVGGAMCIVEEASTGDQVTVEGYVHDGEPVVYGVVDSITYPGSASFLRYQYPSSLPEDVLGRMADVSRRVIRGVGLDRTTFNIEYFWDADKDRLELLEINPRHSQSHARLFQLVDGRPNHQVMVDLALGREPAMPEESGPYAVAAKWMLRHFREDGDDVVRRVPSPEQVADLEREIPGVTVEPVVAAGEHLTDKHGEDVRSVVLAQVHVGGRDEEDLVDKYRRCTEALTFEIDEE